MQSWGWRTDLILEPSSQKRQVGVELESQRGKKKERRSNGKAVRRPREEGPVGQEMGQSIQGEKVLGCAGSRGPEGQATLLPTPFPLPLRGPGQEENAQGRGGH